eukprot:scaffold1817_cov250-Pinguiococcus_pyrenoidosus.AAC.10
MERKGTYLDNFQIVHVDLSPFAHALLVIPRPRVPVEQRLSLECHLNDPVASDANIFKDVLVVGGDGLLVVVFRAHHQHEHSRVVILVEHVLHFVSKLHQLFPNFLKPRNSLLLARKQTVENLAQAAANCGSGLQHLWRNASDEEADQELFQAHPRNGLRPRLKDGAINLDVLDPDPLRSPQRSLGQALAPGEEVAEVEMNVPQRASLDIQLVGKGLQHDEDSLDAAQPELRLRAVLLQLLQRRQWVGRLLCFQFRTILVIVPLHFHADVPMLAAFSIRSSVAIVQERKPTGNRAGVSRDLQLSVAVQAMLWVNSKPICGHDPLPRAAAKTG